jgi:hypothetical protein
MRRPIVAVVIAALALVAAGCGGSSDNTRRLIDHPTDTWVSGFCSAVTTWKNDLQDTTSQLSDTSKLSKDSLDSAANDAKDSTQTFVDSLKSLGKPDTPSGQQIQDSVDKLTTTVDDESKTIQDTASSASGITGVASAITTISTSLSAMATALSQTVQTVQDADASGELKTAFDNCRTARTSRRADAHPLCHALEVMVDVLDHHRALPRRPDATRLTEPARTSPIANTPGTLVT